MIIVKKNMIIMISFSLWNFQVQPTFVTGVLFGGGGVPAAVKPIFDTTGGGVLFRWGV